MKLYPLYIIHYIKEWEMQSKCLQTMFMPADHNAEYAESMEVRRREASIFNS